MDYKEPKDTPDPAYAEQTAAHEGAMTLASQESDRALTSTLASMASAMACLVDPADAAALNEAAAKLMEGGSDGDA